MEDEHPGWYEVNYHHRSRLCEGATWRQRKGEERPLLPKNRWCSNSMIHALYGARELLLPPGTFKVYVQPRMLWKVNEIIV